MANGEPTDIEAEEARDFLKNLKICMLECFINKKEQLQMRYDQIHIYFHNDADGLCSAVLGIVLLNYLKNTLKKPPIEKAHPRSHKDLEDMKKKDDIFYLFLDLQPPSGVRGKNVFCVDHHWGKDPPQNSLIHTVTDPGEEFPSSATLLVAYLIYIAENMEEHNLMSLSEYVNSKKWMQNHFVRDNVLIGTVADNLYMLSDEKIQDKHANGCKFDTKRVGELSDWVGGQKEEIVDLSLGISLGLGSDEHRADVAGEFLERYFKKGDVYAKDPKAIKLDKKLLKKYTEQGKGLIKHVREDILLDSIKFAERRSEAVNRPIQEFEEEIETKSKELKASNEAAFLKFRFKLDPKTTTTTDIKTQYHTKKGHGVTTFTPADFNDLDIVEDRIQKGLRYINTLKRSKEYLKKIKKDGVLGMVVLLPEQKVSQVKGIIASLLYYYGQKNLVLEMKGNYAEWGSRGLRYEQVKEILSSFVIDKEELDYYLESHQRATGKDFKSIQSGANELLKDKIEYLFNIKYMGVGGGRGVVLGGRINDNRIPLALSGLAPSKVKKLLETSAEEGELENLVSTFTGYYSQSIQNIATMLKKSGWIVVQLKESNVLEKIEKPIIYLHGIEAGKEQ